MTAMRIDSSSPIPLYLQVSQVIEQLILQHDLSADEILPGVAVLAKQLQVSPLTVQKAFRHLQERGLIYSIVGKGTFVADVTNQQFVGLLVHSQYLMDGGRAPTLPILVQAMGEELNRHGLRTRLLTDTYPRFQHLSPISPDVITTLEHGRPMGLVMLYHFGSEQLFELTGKRNIPTFGLGSTCNDISASLTHDHVGMLGMALRRMRELGIEDVGVLWLDRGNGRAAQLQAINEMRDVFARHGLKSRPEWLVGVHDATDWAGYHAFNHLMDLPNRPRGLVVVDDVIGRGVHMGTMARQLEVPDDLTVMVQANEDSPITFPDTWLQYGHNLRECARLAVDSLRSLMNGLPPVEKQSILPYRWRPESNSSPWNVTAEPERTGTGRSRMFWTGQQLLNARGSS